MENKNKNVNNENLNENGADETTKKKNIFARGLGWIKGKAEQHPKIAKGCFYVGCVVAGIAIGVGGKTLLDSMDLSCLPGFPDGEPAEDEKIETFEGADTKEDEKDDEED